MTTTNRPGSRSSGTLLLVLLAGFLSSCMSDPNAPKPAAIIEQTELAIAAQKDRLATLPTDHPGRIEAEKAIAKLEAGLVAYKANVDAQEKAGVHPDDAAAIGAVQVVSRLAGPFGAVADVAALLLIPVIGGWIRDRRRANAGEELAKTTRDVAAANGGIIDYHDDATRDQLKAAMSTGARALVERAGAKIPRARMEVKAKAPAKRRKAKAAVEVMA